MNELQRIQPVPILITSYNRINFLKQTIETINERTLYPYYLFVVDNNSTDGSQDYLKNAKVNGKIFDVLLLNENFGQSVAFNKLIEYVESWQEKRPMADWIIFSNDDILPPLLRPKCWLEQMIEIFEKHEKEDGLGALSMRIQRMSRADIDESKDIIYWNKGIPAVFRLMRRSDIRQLGNEPMGKLLKWNSNTVADKLKFFLKKRYGFTVHLYANHIGFCDRKGFPEGVQTFTLAENKLTESDDKPYPDIDTITNVPTKINHLCDRHEQQKREEYQKILNGESRKEITLIILTYRRPNGLKRLIDSIKKYTTDILYDLLIMIDGDDTESYNWCMEQGIKCILSSWNRDFTLQTNLGVYACQTPYFYILADDNEIVENEWLSKSLKIFKDKFPDGIGIMGIQEGLQNGRIFTCGMSSKRFVNYAGGHMYDPRFLHYCGDNVLTAWVKLDGKYHYEESIKINHYHPSHKIDELKAPNDETYQISKKYSHQDDVLKKQIKGDIDKLLKNKNYYDWFFKE